MKIDSQFIQVLIVEDQDTVRELLVTFINSIKGYQVSGTAKNTWEARLELTRRRPHLVLLDEVLPGESIHDLIVDIKSQYIPIFLLTSVEEPTHRLAEGVVSRLKKPSWKSLEKDRETWIKVLNQVGFFDRT